MKKVELHTERLLLRAPVMADVEHITAACQDPDIQRWVPIPVPYSETDALSYVRDYSDRGWESGNCCTWAIVHDGHFAGAIGLDGIAGEEPTIGYWMEPGSRRNGLLDSRLPGHSEGDVAFDESLNPEFACCVDEPDFIKQGWDAIPARRSREKIIALRDDEIDGVWHRDGGGDRFLETAPVRGRVYRRLLTSAKSRKE